ncbi:protein CURLY FLAG LEAF 1-like isoform X2 [Magnolia sinica]|uniref:protein CURLY FLAG LEAF 1-like isoform X2 n=1 Tax=Magnolia sinica TaxID=86752 RepID=UPI002658B343|nr:protein CURLY FLAG LEAF 1-like isoform X2 [Magnolia sinica]
MTAPNMATITASLARSLQNCSISSSSPQAHESTSSSSSPSAAAAAEAATLELNSHVSLPYQWEQCLDLKTGEIYYINWRSGMKAKEDPRKAARFERDYYSEEDSSEESEGGGGGSCLSASSTSSPTRDVFRYDEDHVLVVAGCKSCLMYFMLPKTVVECPKCGGMIMHFDRVENGCL